MARVSKPHFNPSSPDYHALHTVEDVTERNVQTILELEEAAKANRSTQIQPFKYWTKPRIPKS